jgi:hypothetical protein
MPLIFWAKCRPLLLASPRRIALNLLHAADVEIGFFKKVIDTKRVELYTQRWAINSLNIDVGENNVESVCFCLSIEAQV